MAFGFGMGFRFGSRQGGGAALFDPSGDAQVLLWHDARAGITLTDDKVSAWAPRVGTGTMVNANSGNRPSIGSLNGYQALSFGGSHALRASNITGVAQPFTIMAFISLSTLTGTQNVWTGEVTLTETAGNTWAISPGGGAGGSSEAATVGQHAMAAVYNGADTALFDNGVELTLTDTMSGTSAPGTFTVGASTLTGTSALNGLVGETIIIGGAISDGDRQIYEGYLAHRWGAAAILPGGHPYKDNPPTAADFGSMLMYEAGSPLMYGDSGYLRAA